MIGRRDHRHRREGCRPHARKIRCDSVCDRSIRKWKRDSHYYKISYLGKQEIVLRVTGLDTSLRCSFGRAKAVTTTFLYQQPPPPPSTMASKLGIDLEGSTPGSSRPGSALSGAFASSAHGPQALSKGGEEWETFKGKGETLGGRKTKGRGISKRKIEDHMEDSKIYRTE